MQKSIYDTPQFFERYQLLRENPKSLNEIVEKPTMFSLLPELQGKRVLDLGCGTGEHLQHYLAQGAAFAVGLDLSQSMLLQAEKNLARNAINPTAYRLYCLPMEHLAEIEEGQFDLIVSSFAFHYIEDFAALLQAIKGKLKTGGILLFSQEHPIATAHKIGARWEKDQHKQQTAYRLNHYREEGLRERNWFQQPFKTYHRTMATIFNQMIEAGFEIERVAEPMLAECPQWHNEFKDLLHRPPLLFVKAKLHA
jgi:SAM-dependent methyltransferase